MKNTTLEPKQHSMTTNLIAALASVPLCFACACGVEPAGGPEGGDPGADATPARHCVSVPGGPATCFATFTEAIAFATGGEIADAPADSLAVRDDDGFADRINAIARQRTADVRGGAPIPHAGDIVIGISYLDAGFHGNTWVFLEATGCDGNLLTVDFAVPNLNTKPFSDFGFNDSISSFRSFSGCQTLLNDDWFYSGPATNNGVPITDMDFVGSLRNDKASSIRWF
ncbi:MAG TPA: hypothetical protein VFT22_04210 [Kofleriaceae bacterium]|nr:hypothetical protein [Kofleriaceae bacterium]